MRRSARSRCRHWPAGATTTSTATSRRTASWSTRCSTTATPRSAAGPAPAAWHPARTSAAAAGPARPRPSAASTRDAPPHVRQVSTRASGSRTREEDPHMTAPALVALAHGSRDPRSAATITALVDEVRSMRPDLRIEPAFLDLSKPGFQSVVDKLVRAGYDEIVVVPLLLTQAFHAKVDVPGAVAAATERHTGLQIRATQILGLESVFLEVLDRRMRDALREA